HQRRGGLVDLLGVLEHLDHLLEAAGLLGAVGVLLPALLLLRGGLGLALAGHGGWGPLGGRERQQLTEFWRATTLAASWRSGWSMSRWRRFEGRSRASLRMAC